MINIYTFQFNQPDFLEYQFRTFSKFLSLPHKLICVNNAYDNHYEKRAILDKASQLGIAHVIPENIDYNRGPGYSHQDALNWTWNNFIANSSDPVIIVDHDMFPIKTLNFDFSYDITGISQGRGEYIRYFHPGFMLINNIPDKNTIDFRGQKIDGHNCDTGGNWHHYLLAHPELKIKGLLMQAINYSQETMKFLPESVHSSYDTNDQMEIVEDYMIHFRNGSNWAHTNKYQFNSRVDQLKQTLDYYLK